MNIKGCGNCGYYKKDEGQEVRYYCHHPALETDDPYVWAVLIMEPEDICSRYERRKDNEGE